MNHLMRISALAVAFAFALNACAIRKPVEHPEGQRFGNISQRDATGTTKTLRTNTDAGVDTLVVDINNMPAISIDGGITASSSGPAANGAAVSGNPVRIGGSDGTLTRDIKTDTSGNETIVGPGAAGAAVSGAPVRMGGSDGTNTRDVKTDSSGDVLVTGMGTAGANAGGYVNIQGNASGVPVPVTGTITAVTSLGSVSTSVTPGTSAAHLGKAEDAAHGDGDTLVAVAARRIDTAASSAGSSGDYATINTDANGRLWTNGVVTQSNSTWLSSQVSNADITSAAADWTTCKTVWILLTIDGTSSPVGNVSVLTSVDNSDFTPKLIFDANKAYGSTNGAVLSFTSASATIAYTGSSTTTLNIPITDPPPYGKLFVDNTSGGTTGNRINAQWYCRSN